MRKAESFGAKRKRRITCWAVILLGTAALLPALQQTLARQTYVITDGSRVLVHTTSATDPQTVLSEAGLHLDANDTYTVHTGDGTPQICVLREQKLVINYYGEQIRVTSQGETVEELLTRLGLSRSHWDRISPPPDARTCDGMELTVDHVVRELQTYTAQLPHETVRCSDPSLPEGTEKIVTAGVDGEVLCDVEVTYTNGVETQRRELSRQVVAQPVSEIVAVGCGQPEEKTEESRTAAIGARIVTLPTGEVVTYTEKVKCLATAYNCEGYVGTTATGTRARVGAIAVDPEVFPYGTRFYTETRDGEYIYGVATAEDCGDKRFIYGTRLDLYFDTEYECVQFGARMCDVYILG